MPTPDKHALLSASASERWLHCTQAPRLEETLPEQPSTYAEEGTLAHALAELKARKKFVEPMGTRAYNSRHKKLAADPLYTSEMEGHTDTYIDALSEEAMRYPNSPSVALEVVVDYSAYAAEGFGTADCIMIGGDCLTVCDFKYGKGVPVSAVGNTQLMLYALGALALYKPFYGDLIQRVRIRIIQPRAGGGSDWEVTRKELEDWGETVVKPKAQLAYTGEGEFEPGHWCKFCRAKAQCRARSQEYLALEAFGMAKPEGGLSAEECLSRESDGYQPKQPPLLSDAEVGDILRRAEDLATWAKELKDYALTACLDGREIPGWKAVEGRSVRAWSDQDKAMELLQASGYPKEVLYDYAPKTLSQVEQMLGKSTFLELVGDLVIKPAGKPALAPDSDKRPQFNPAQAAFA